jgi:hypothetical protein
MSTSCSFHNNDVPENAPTYVICACKTRVHEDCFRNISGDETTAAAVSAETAAVVPTSAPKCPTCGEKYSMRRRVCNSALCSAVVCKEIAKILFVVSHLAFNLFLAIGFSYDAETLATLGGATFVSVLGLIVHLVVVIIGCSDIVKTMDDFNDYKGNHPRIFRCIYYAANLLPINHRSYYIMYAYTAFGITAQLFGIPIVYAITGMPMMNIITYVAGHIPYAAAVIIAASAYCVKHLTRYLFFHVCTVEQHF